ncbi:MAG: chemotaxis protein CheA [Myxococcales bacterium]|nr:chemotaxis protein CheA [Myxococcales bacterium]MDD9969007.1 chemotaxis protein CheA [Myxococcales bacterium]
MDTRALLDSFIMESLDHVDALEQALLQMRNQGDPECVHVAFRAVHSIKGSCSTFGLSHLSEFSHDVEDTLDRLRTGELCVNRDLSSALLDAVDLLRTLLSAASHGQDEAVPDCAQVLSRIAQASGQQGAASKTVQGSAPHATWRIRISPSDEALLVAEPLTVIAGLSSLGNLSSRCLGNVPPLEAFDPNRCYVHWDLTLEGGEEAEVRDWLDWLEDGGDVHLEPLGASQGTPGAQPTAPTQATPARSGKADRDLKQHQSRSIRVEVDKVDGLMNMLGELVIDQAMLKELVAGFTPAKLEALHDAIASLEEDTRALQSAVMRLRMLPASVLLQRLPRLVDDLSTTLGKEVDLVVEGERTEIDKRVLEELADPLTHMIRNALDHGLESPLERQQRGKPRRGTLRVSAFHRGGFVNVEVADDGRGLNTEEIVASACRKGLMTEDEARLVDVHELIFAAGLTTAERVTDVSGRGVGMDVVRRNIEVLGGTIGVSSEPGRGCKLTVRLPLTLAIMDGQLVRVGDETYVVPVLSIVESVRARECRVRPLPSGMSVLHFRDGDVPVIDVHKVLGVPPSDRPGRGLMVVAEADRGLLALTVDELLGQQQIVLKSLKQNYGNVPGISAATILGNGQVSMILDVHSLAQLARSPDRPTPSLRSREASVPHGLSSKLAH